MRTASRPAAPRTTPGAYAKWRATRLGRITERTETGVVLDLAGDVRGQRVLDVGSGDGNYALALARLAADVTAVDVDRAMIDAARERADERELPVHLVAGAAEALPFRDESFDVAVAVTVLCFVDDPRAALREVARVLRPGGRLVLGELSAASVWAARRRIRGWLGDPTWARARFWSERELMSLLRAAGLDAAETRRAVFFPPSALLALGLHRIDPVLGRMNAPGAAFLAVRATKAR